MGFGNLADSRALAKRGGVEGKRAEIVRLWRELEDKKERVKRLRRFTGVFFMDDHKAEERALDTVKCRVEGAKAYEKETSLPRFPVGVGPEDTMKQLDGKIETLKLVIKLYDEALDALQEPELKEGHQVAIERA